jgi:hypothetical protein
MDEWPAVVDVLNNVSAAGLTYPFPEPPATDEVKLVSPGALWIRIPLPFRLNHINVDLIEDGDD